MLQIPAVFSDHALFQHSAGLTIRGQAAGAAVTVRLCREDKSVCMEQTTADEQDRFFVSLQTPSASFTAYRCELTDGEDTRIFCDWLFGELWMAVGQSNMDLAVCHMPDEPRFHEAVFNKVMRFYYQEFGDLSTLPEQPEDTVGGTWCTAEGELFCKVSACGSLASAEIYVFLNRQGENVPVGLVNCNMGATFIENWLPREAVEQDGEMKAYLSEKHGLLPFGQPWNGYGGENYRQPYGLYNRKVAALIGIQLRGIFWYQGESNVGGRLAAAYYKQAMLTYQRVYESLFLAQGCEHLPVVCVQLFAFLNIYIYPSAETECRMGYFNESFIEAAKEAPEKFSVVPIYDLPAVFAPYSKKVYPHPVHPMHKYALGKRVGRAAVAKAYGAPRRKNGSLL